MWASQPNVCRCAPRLHTTCYGYGPALSAEDARAMAMGGAINKGPCLARNLDA